MILSILYKSKNQLDTSPKTSIIKEVKTIKKEVIDISSLENRIKAICMMRDTNLKELSVKLGINYTTFVSRLKVGKFTIEQLEEIAQILDCKFKNSFETSDGKIF